MTVFSVRKKLGISQMDYEPLIARKVSVNGEEPCTMTDYLYTNLIEADVDHISIEDAMAVTKLEVGETHHIYPGEVTRTK